MIYCWKGMELKELINVGKGITNNEEGSSGKKFLEVGLLVITVFEIGTHRKSF